MRTIRGISAATLVLACLASACSHSVHVLDRADGGAGAALIDEFARAWCEYAIRCEADFAESRYRVHTQVRRCHPSLGYDVSHLEFATDDLRAEIEWVRALPCHDEYGSASAFSRQTQTWSRITEGGDCVPSEGLCADGLACLLVDACSARCERDARGVGDPCSRDRPCPHPYWCDDMTGVCSPLPDEVPSAPGTACLPVGSEDSTCILRDHFECVDGRCEQRDALALGTPCQFYGSGPPCVAGARCGLSASGPVCVPEVTIGSPCDFTLSACIAGSTCVVLGDTSICTASEPGSTCVRSSECPAEAPFCVDFACSADYDGELCRPQAWFWVMVDSCRPGYRCTRGGACRRIAATGSACGAESPCEGGTRCVDGRCVHIAAPGEPCGTDAVCPLTHGCSGGVCAPLPLDGEPCIDACFASVCRDGRCALLADGESCGSSTVGCEHRCVDGTCVPALREGETCAECSPLFEGCWSDLCAEGLACVESSEATYTCEAMVCEESS